MYYQICCMYVQINQNGNQKLIFLLFMTLQIILINPHINSLCIRLTHHFKANFDQSRLDIAKDQPSLFLFMIFNLSLSSTFHGGADIMVIYERLNEDSRETCKFVFVTRSTVARCCKCHCLSQDTVNRRRREMAEQ